MDEFASDRKRDALQAWLLDLESRHRSELSFREVRRAVQALSSLYVERRSRAAPGAAFGTAGKRAAYALFYGPLHYLTVQAIVRRLRGALPGAPRIVDLGCGTGAAGAAWAVESGREAAVEGIDRSEWAVGETLRTLRALGVRGRARRGSIERARLPGKGGAIVAGWAVNELGEPARGRLLEGLLEAARAGARVLVVEPIAKGVAPWWTEWSGAFRASSGRDDSWRFRVELPEGLALLDRAAGLDHRELTARSLALNLGGTAC